jgi:hypothetical protein
MSCALALAATRRNQGAESLCIERGRKKRKERKKKPNHQISRIADREMTVYNALHYKAAPTIKRLVLSSSKSIAHQTVQVD